MATNDFLPFANSGGANVVSQSTYAGNTTLLANGVQTGIASSAYYNKTARQAATIANVVTTLINDKTGQNTLDDGTTATLIANLSNTIALNNVVSDASGTVNVMTAALTPIPTISDGYVITIKPAISNTGATTLNLNGLGAFAVVTSNGPLVGGELLNGKYYQMVWLAATNNWLLLGTAITAVTQATPDNSTKIATTAFVKNQAYAPLASPALTGTPTAPTPGSGDNSTIIATTAFVKTAVTNATGALGTMATQNANAVAITGGSITGTTVNSVTVGTNASGTKTVSTGAPSGGSNGDIWLTV